MLNCAMGHEGDDDVGNLECYGSNCQYEYKNGDYIGRGTFGIVYKAKVTKRGHDFTGDNVVAIKVIHMHGETEQLNNAGAWKKLTDRWQKLLRLRHDHLVSYHKICVVKALAGPSVEFVMDYYCDRDLYLLLNKLKADKATLDQSDIICYAMQIADGVQYLHQNSIIHGDLKPANVLLKRTTNKHHTVLVADLDDLVKMRHASTSFHDISKFRGTLQFMSPEMLRKYLEMAGEPVAVGRKTDVWSLGCIFVELASAGKSERWLYNKTTRDYVQCDLPDHQFADKIIGGFVPCAANPLPEFMTRCIESCLQTDKAKRIDAAAIPRMLQESVKIFMSSSGSSKDETSKCICTDQSAFTRPALQTQMSEAKSLSSGSKEVALLFHFFKSDGMTPNAAVQLFDPTTATLRSLPFPGVLKEAKNFSRNFLLMDKEFVCKVDTDKLIAFDFVRQTSRSFPFPSSAAFRYMDNHAALNKKIYFWKRYDDCPLQVLDLLGETVSAMPKPSKDIVTSSAQLIPYRDKVVCCVNSREYELRWVECFDPASSQWETFPDMLDIRKEYAWAQLGSSIYIIGGINQNLEYMKSCVRLDMETRTWEEVADLPRCRAYHGATAVDGRIHVFGGSVNGRSLSQTVEVYDPMRDAWSDQVSENLDKRDFDKRSLIGTTVVSFEWPLAFEFPV